MVLNECSHYIISIKTTVAWINYDNVNNECYWTQLKWIQWTLSNISVIIHALRDCSIN